MATIDLGLANSRRLRVVYIPQSFVAHMLAGMHGDEFIRVPKPDLPPTAVVIAVYDDHRRRAFCMVVEDISFDDVMEGMELPEMRVEWNVVKLAVDKPAGLGFGNY